VILRVFTFLAVALLLTACSDTGSAFETFTYPEEFNYPDDQELDLLMQQFGYALQQLDLALVSQEDDRPDLQQQVIGYLRNIERIGGNLQASDISASHPFLRDDMSVFLSDVREARLRVALFPPRYYMAGRIAGGCVNCHRVNR